MIIITGGAGFIGSAILWKLNLLGLENIIVVDKLGKDEKWKNLRPLKFYDFIDKNEFLNIKDKIKNIKVIFHMGACTDTKEKDADFLIKNNFEYSKNLAIFAISNNIRFIYASSAATYGDGKYGFSDNEENLEKLKPLNIYGYSKHLFDLWIKRNRLLDKVVGLKYFNVFGPNEYHKKDMRSKVIKAYEEIKREGKIKLFKSYKKEFSNGEQKRDFIYIKDVAEVTLFFFKNPKIFGIFNVGTGIARSWNDLAKAIFSCLNLPLKIEYIDMPDDLKDQYQYFTKANIEKLRKVGCNIKFKSLEEAIKDYITNYLKKNYLHLGEETS